MFGAYLLAVYDPDTERYQTISKLGTGFSEEQLQVRGWGGWLRWLLSSPRCSTQLT